MKKELQTLQEEFLGLIKEAHTMERIEALRVEYLGRKGKIAGLMKRLPELTNEARKEAGMVANEVKGIIEGALSESMDVIAKEVAEQKEQAEWIDISLPGIAPETGHLHPITQTIEEIVEIFHKLGFVYVRHPEVEWDYYAFESLNVPKDHPARDEWETFFIGNGEEITTGELGRMVLTPQTSSGQVREMEKGDLPIRMLNINKTYRRQSDISHVPMFHQFEGLVIDKKVTIAELKGTLDHFVKQLFGETREVRLRPYHFRFTEPSFEIDISCDVCKGTGHTEDGSTCRLCKEGWLELGGAGMVHPNVLKAGGIDPNEYTGFAFGWGVERTMMMKSGINIDDMRILYRNDLRFLNQF